MLIGKIKTAESLHKVFQPIFFNLSNELERHDFEKLLDTPNITVHNEIYGQLKVLFKIRNPRKKYTAEEYDQHITAHLSGLPIEEYGMWVYYPWSHKLVHILGREEFIEVRTSANRNKITTEECNILATKKVGVIGLSVGQSVSVMLAMERGCGELRMADFDAIELNNLNRLRTGLHNLELSKAYAVAREIAEIDPYFKVICYPEGITEDNINHFLTNGGNLDVVIDECDGIDIKLLCRIKAKELNIPVLMESSDRSTLDVERYDLEPNRSIMHGYLDHLPINFDILKKLQTNEEKLPYMLPLTGLETLSNRMKASMIEIPNTISTWPQLATSVAMGGAITADTCRRIFLDQFTDSGRYYIDLENLIRDIRPKRKGYEPDDYEPELITEKEMAQIAEMAMPLFTAAHAVSKEDIQALVAAATQAPSAGNCQPWKWYYSNNVLFLFRDNNYLTSYADIEGIETHIAIGAAIENLELKAKEKNIGIGINYFPLVQHENLVALIQFTNTGAGDSLHQPEKLVANIELRNTNRKPGKKIPLTNEEYNYLKDAATSIPGAMLIIKDAPEDLMELGAILGTCDRLKLLNPVTHFEFYKKMRWSTQESVATQDGVNVDELGLSQPEIIALRLVKKPEVIQLLSDWHAGQPLEYSTFNKVTTSSAIVILTMPQLTAANSLLMGRALQRVWLTATEHNIALQPLQDLVTQFLNIQHRANIMQPNSEIISLHQRFQKIFNTDSKCAYFLFRLSKGVEQTETRSYRKSADKVLFLSNNKQ